MNRDQNQGEFQNGPATLSDRKALAAIEEAYRAGCVVGDGDGEIEAMPCFRVTGAMEAELRKHTAGIRDLAPVELRGSCPSCDAWSWWILPGGHRFCSGCGHGMSDEISRLVDEFGVINWEYPAN